MAIESISKSVPHDVPEYFQIALLGAGGLALSTQVAIRKLNPQKASLLVQRCLLAINIKCPRMTQRCYDFSLRSFKWIQANESTIVPVVGLTAAAYKSSVDSREQKMKEAKAEIEKQIKNTEIRGLVNTVTELSKTVTELTKTVMDLQEKSGAQAALIEVLRADVTRLKKERPLDKGVPPVDYKSLSTLRSSTVQATPKREWRDIRHSQAQMREFLNKLAPCIDSKPLTPASKALTAASEAGKVQDASSQEIRIYKEKIKLA